tara:strand:+ start:219 stop:410 length:192 start_codon:yes stop_codon:yes gene_type:complete
MPDISLCTSEICPMREKCYRSVAKPNEHRQSYSNFDSVINPAGDSCGYFMEISGRPTVNDKDD